MSELASQTLHSVAREVSAALTEARNALENFVEHTDNTALLERCVEQLHQVRGALRVMEIHGGALLSEEMEHVGRYLLGAAVEKRTQPEALDGLMRALVQLPSYLERVHAGGRDTALVLLPLLNDLRAVRGGALLSEGTLLLLNLKSDRQAQPLAAAVGEPPLTVAQWARRLRSRFQAGLVGWIRSERHEQHLESLAAVALRMEQVATEQCVFQLWWVTGALLESLRENGIEASVAVKRLLGLADRELRRLYEEGEARYAQDPPVELINNLLYYIARATTTGPRVSAVRASFRLNELLPVDEDIEQERDNLSAPSVKLMHTVAAAIREDLGRIKDVLDIFVRRGSRQVEELRPQTEMLRKLADTLGVLGLGELRTRVLEANTRLMGVVAGEHSPDMAELVQIAATLIRVDDHLDDQLVGLIVPRKPASDQLPADTDQDFQQVQAAVLRECVVNLVRIKESVAQNVSGNLDAAGFDSWPELMRGIKAGLLILGKSRAAEILESIAVQLKRVMQPGASSLSGEYLDRLADAIVSVEYYIETLQAGRSDPWYMLDNAQRCIEALSREPTHVIPTVDAVEPEDYPHTMRLTPRSELLTAESENQGDRAPSSPVLPPMLPAAGAAVGGATASVDPDLLHLFIEEAREELASIQKHYPQWDENPLETGALEIVRRSFHTLKGSGRMVGARELGEFAWSVENLLNRMLDGTLTRSPQILETLRDAIARLPSLVRELESGAAHETDVGPLVARAHALAAGRETGLARQEPAASPAAGSAFSLSADADATGMPITLLPVPLEPVESSTAFVPPPVVSEAEAAGELPPSGIDHALREIYARETSNHIGTVRDWLAREWPHPAPHVLPEEVYRACHTMCGSSKMAEARHGIRLAEPMEHWLRKSFDSGVGLDDADLTLLGNCMDAMHSVAGHLDESTGYFTVHSMLRARLARAEADLERRIAEFAAPGERSGPRLPSAFAEPPPPVASSPSPQPSMPPLPSAPTYTETSSRATPDFDIEVASIFCEEALELLESAQAAMLAWNSSGDDPLSVAALKRPLHTLKGGARMAGIEAMGDLAHELESLVIQIEMGNVASGDSARQVAQQALDELAHMRENVAAGRASQSATALIALIHDVAHGSSLWPQLSGVAPATDRPAAFAPVEPLPAASAEPSPATPPDAAPAPAPMLTMTMEIPPLFMVVPVDAVPVREPESHPGSRAATTPAVNADALWASEPQPRSDAHPAVPPPEPVFFDYAHEDTPAWPVAVEPSAPPPPAVTSAPPFAPVTAEIPPLAATVLPPGREPVVTGERSEQARVSTELLDQLLNNAGEVSVVRARLEQQLSGVEFNLAELSRTVIRLKEQLRKLELETEAQILHRHGADSAHRHDFDPLELDRYSSIQQFSRALAESTSDVASLQQLLESMVAEAQNQLQQQSRLVTDLQNGLMHTRMVPFQRHVQRLSRIVRQAANETAKQVELFVEGGSGELDRQVLERMLPPLEHMLRNAVVHGIEFPEVRRERGKRDTGSIHLSLRREGAEVIVELRDDGAGMDLEAIRAKGLSLGLITSDQSLSDDDVMQLVLEPGFSTVGAVTQQAGRGVGMDVVATEIKKLGGALHMQSTRGQGTQFIIKLPFTLAISHALIVRTGDEYYALPLPTIEGVVRLPRDEVAAHLRSDGAFTHDGQKYRVQSLSQFVGLESAGLPEQEPTIPVVLVRAGEHSTALVADELIGSREIVVKPVGPQLASIRGISGATILSDGRVVIILDIGALVRSGRRRALPMVARERADVRTFVMVVDDSITVRRVTQRLLERNGMRVITARDGMDAMSLLQENRPDIILLDIEMPRMDGYEVAAQVRADPVLHDVPIIMITSRVGEKHRARAIELGVNDYLGKPYQESQLLDAIAPLVARHRGAALHAANSR
jgi:chemosensory pili system protein ChpA (sensor histidine kinase/response regulator)